MPKLSEEQFDRLAARILRNNWHILLLAGLVVLAAYIRLLSLGLVQRYLPDIDTYLFYRLSNYLISNNFHMMAWDTLRNYPFGLGTLAEQPLPYYLPALFYKLAGIFSGGTYLDLVKYYSPLVTAIAAIPMYLVGRELKDKWAGIFSAFFFAIMPAILMRNPAGYIEKEPSTLFFMVLSVYFFIRTLRKDSWLSAALTGMSLLFVDIGWGGVKHLYLGFAIFGFLMVLLNRYSNALLKCFSAIPVAVFIGARITSGTVFESDHLMIFGTFALVFARFAAERFKLIKESQMKYLSPALIFAALFIVIVGSFFTPSFASLIQRADDLLFYKDTTFGGTVAENQRPDINSFYAQFGTPYASAILPFLGSSIILLSSWILAFAAIIRIIYKEYDAGDKFRWPGIFAALALFATFLLFLKSPGSSLQNIFIISLFATLILITRKDSVSALLAAFLFAAMLGFLGMVRVGFLMGPYIAIFAAYFISEAVSRVMSMDSVKNAGTLEEKINIYSVGAGGIIALILIANLAAGYTIGSSMGPNYNDNWNGAMNFMKDNTPESSVILSWWDFGYWFQAMSGRATMLDGGNNDVYGDKLAGLYFSGRMNETVQKEFLQSRGITHIIVDYSMVGKYPAMTRIGTDWQEVDSYIQLGQPQQIQRNGRTILVFQLSPSAFYVPLDQNGSISGNIVFKTPQGDANLKYLCTESGLVDLSPPDPSMDACLIISRNYGVFFPVDASHGRPSTMTGTSVFAKLFFFDGKGVDYVKKVYDNPEVKIYEVQLPRKTREELINWWYENGSTFELKDAFVEARLQSLKSMCVKGNDINKC